MLNFLRSHFFINLATPLKNLDQMNITFYKDIFDTKENHAATIETALQRIKNGDSKDKVQAIRKEKDKTKRNKLKQGLTCVIFGGTFSERKKDCLIKASGFAILDFDDIDINYKKELSKNNFIYSVWVSPSGNGLKALVKIPIVENDKQYKSYYNALLADFKSANVDKSTKDISRVAYESFDPEIYINENAKVYKNKIVDDFKEPKKINIIAEANDSETYEKLTTWINKTDQYVTGNRNSYLFKLAAACNSFGLNKQFVINTFNFSFDLPERELNSLINSAYKNTSDFNTQRFDSSEQIREVRQLLAKGTTPKKIKDLIGATDETINRVNDNLNRRISTFWEVIEADPKKSKYVIIFNLEKFINWLEGNGFFKHIINNGEFILIKITNNIIKQVYQHDIRRFAYDYINNLPFEFDNIFRSTLQTWFFDKEKKIISQNVFELLTTKKIDFYKDSKHTATIFYKNQIARVTKDKITLSDYKDFNDFIWEEQILPRNFEIKEYSNDSIFETFIKNIIGANVKNQLALYSAIGYLIHQYKPTNFAPAIVLNDKIISDDPNGGTGKGIFAKAISEFKTTVTLDGKSFDFTKTFAFQRVELSTDLLVFDDIKKSFSFETLFSVITEGITVEQKNKGEFFIPFEKAPKILITTNYALKGEGNSIERRKVDFELEQYYTNKKTPYDEFGKMLFKEFTEDEYLQFDTFMIYCVQYYLKEGLQKPENENLNLKRLIANTSNDFISYMNDFSQFEDRIAKSDFHTEFIKETNLRSIKSNTLTIWIKKWCNFYGHEYKDIVYNGTRYFEIYKK